MLASRCTRLLAALLLSAISLGRAQQRGASYYPGPHPHWEHRAPAALGMDARLLDSAIAFAKASESTEPRDLEQNHQLTWGREPHNEPIGPFKPRGPATGVIVRNGYIVAEWGEPARVDMTFSVTKSFLSSTVAVAYDRGMIHDLSDTVRAYVTTGEFDSEHNRAITWDHLL